MFKKYQRKLKLEKIICSFWDNRKSRPFPYLIRILPLYYFEGSRICLFSWCFFWVDFFVFNSATCIHYCRVAHTLLSLVSVGLVEVVKLFFVFLFLEVFLFEKQFF